MRLLVIQPNWDTYSEVWLKRMRDLLEPHIVALAAFSPSVTHWNNKPVFDLYGSKPNRFKRLLNKIIFERQDLTVSNEIQKLVDELKIDKVLIHFIGPAVYLKEFVLNVKIPVFIHVHGIDVFWDAKAFDEPFKKIHNPEYPQQVLELSKHVLFIANSNLTKDQLMNIGVPEKKIFIKSFGVPLPIVNSKIVNETLKILYLGRMVDFKGPDLVIMAFENALRKGLDAELVMAGDGPLYPFCEILKRRSEFSDKIKLIGKVNEAEASKLYQWADIYTMHSCKGVLSETFEAFGVSVIEAMSYGLPVVTGNFGGPKEIIDNGVNGILVSSGNVDEHADAFIKLSYPNRRKEIGKAAIKTINEKFTISHEKNSLMDILMN